MIKADALKILQVMKVCTDKSVKNLAAWTDAKKTWQGYSDALDFAIKELSKTK